MSDLYYDPYAAINDPDPYPLYARMREEAPLYYNEKLDFYAVTRYEDCERGLVDAKRFISGRGGILELIKANIELPPGNLIFEDPPAHDVHRSLLSRVFTPRRVSARSTHPSAVTTRIPARPSRSTNPRACSGCTARRSTPTSTSHGGPELCAPTPRPTRTSRRAAARPR